jgi:salicylate hydroxylase
VYEQAPELGEVGAGVQISPNGARALDALGVFETLKAASCAPRRKEFRLWNTGRAWPMFDLGQMAIEKYGYPYLTVYRPDLLGTLVDAVRAMAPQAIHLGAAVGT